MSGPLGSSQWMYASGGYEIEQSLRFNDDDTAYLSKTFAASGNTKKWTYSCWYKRGDLDGQSHTLFSTARGATNDFDYIRVQTDDSVYVAVRDNSSNYILRIITNRKLRDPNAWYHILVRFDSTASTPSSTDCALYINGVRETNLAAEVLPSQNDTTRFNSNVEHHIGQWNGDSSFYLDGHLAEVNFIDGQSLDASYFGETDDDYGHWKPIQYAGTYGTNGFYLPFNSTQGIIAANGGSIATSGDYKVHTFTSSGTFTPTTVPTSGAFVQYLVVGGGGAGGRGWNWGGGGGAGGMREGYLEVSAQDYTITVGAGGVYTSGGGQGGNSAFGSITATGGGAGQSGHGEQGAQTATSGGSGGGSISTSTTGVAGQGYAGGTGTGGLNPHGGGGGGAGEPGSTDAIMDGGDGRASNITGSSVVYAGGGAGRREDNANGTGGTGGGGSAASGTDGLGGGGGSASGNTNGGSGVVIIRYRFQ